MRRHCLVLLLLSTCTLPLLAGDLAKPIQFAADAIPWQAGKPPMPAGSEFAVLEGDPKSNGLYTMRLRVPASTTLDTHSHMRDERATVLSGAVEVRFDSDAEPVRFGPGAYYVNPASVPHTVHFPEETVLQITGFGPWTTEMRKADPATGTLEIRSVSPAAGSVIGDESEIVVAVSYSIENFRLGAHHLTMQFDSTRPRVSISCPVITRAPVAVPATSPVETLKREADSVVLACSASRVLSNPEIAKPLRVRVLLHDAIDGGHSRSIAESEWIEFR